MFRVELYFYAHFGWLWLAMAGYGKWKIQWAEVSLAGGSLEGPEFFSFGISSSKPIPSNRTHPVQLHKAMAEATVVARDMVE